MPDRPDGRHRQSVGEHFIGTRGELLKTAFGLGLESHGLYDAAIVMNGDRGQLVSKIATAARGLLLASIDYLLVEGASPENRAALLDLLENRAGIESAGRLSRAELEKEIAALPDTGLVAMLPDGIVPLVDCWCPQLWHRLAPAALKDFDWGWLRQQIAALRAQGMASPGIMLSPNAEVAMADLSVYGGALPQMPDPDTHVLVSVHPGVAEIILVMTWAELETSGLARMEKVIWDATRSTRASRAREPRT